MKAIIYYLMLIPLLGTTQTTLAAEHKDKVAQALREAADDGSLANLCAALPVPCDFLSTKRYHLVDQPSRRYLIDASKPMLVALDEQTPNNTSLAKQWNFSGYRHSYSVSDDAEAEPLSVYPALYRLPDGRDAVALVKVVTEMYSGGGGRFEIADFLALDTTSGIEHKPTFSSVPFACQKTVRACFSDQEYRHSKHCHEESSGYLTLTPDKSGWQWHWVQSVWPAHVAQTAAHKQKQTFAPSTTPGQLPEGAAFCDGPQ